MPTDIGEVVEARAPGKVIISGEHAVVHGTPAVAAALNRYTQVRITRPLASKVGDGEVLSLHLPDLQVHLKWPVEFLKKSLDFPLTETTLPAQTEGMKASIEELVKKEMPSNLVSGASEGVTAFFFLYLSILGLTPLEVVVTSELPVGAGLGSSAAFCVSVAAALLTLAGKLKLQAEASESKWMDLEDRGRDLVNSWAFEGEKIIHGKPSGVDNNVSCYGYIVRFQKGNLTRLRNPMQVRMLITNTKVSRNTKALVAGVAVRAKRHPTAMAAVFQAVESICEEIVSILESPTSEESTNLGDGKTTPVVVDDMVKSNGAINESKLLERPDTEQEYGRLEELMAMNQGLLQCMGVSHPSIESICQTTSKFNLCSKLTGAGGGGCVLTLLPYQPQSTGIQNVKSQLESLGYQCFEAGIGGKGVQISYGS